MRRTLFLALLLMVFFSCKKGKKYHDESKVEIENVSNGTLKDILEFQVELNEEFKNPETSPLPDRYRKDFTSLDFFDLDTNYVVKAKFVLTPDALPFLMPTTTERESEETVYGIAYFELNGEEHQLELYRNKELMQEEGYEDYLFLPFTDKTNGEETYAGGRYIDLSIPEGDSITIDFNKAYNPYCAYNKKFSCPLVPSVNALDTKVLAGVKDFKKGKG
ncbi:DUF1684 domain-containing protein [Maribacter polysiphoniae]|uniref:DUF1684 domain-containing protein n=1 Tax=Maribacter polysiphoniae TaxID=429344 RepID=A0A316E583_9FLAO|nr:DUF1684 domain-containing protein [Maribacter polysiphoniae]MBD1259239.1 DUF1684 domain-containing protein [Maribacter polysiphoniae]PWK24798.1 hypothetical protein LX92_01163 [Maribacter polysiphoniae]